MATSPATTRSTVATRSAMMTPETAVLARTGHVIEGWSETAPEVSEVYAQVWGMAGALPVLAEGLSLYADSLLERRMSPQVVAEVSEASEDLLAAAGRMLRAKQKLAKLYQSQMEQEESGVEMVADLPTRRHRPAK